MVRITKLTGIVLSVILGISLLSIWSYPSINDFMAGNTMWNGIRDFMKEYEAGKIDSFDNVPVQNKNTAIVSIAYTTYTPEELQQLYEFVVDGGILLLLDDFGYGNEFLQYAGIPARFSNDELLDLLFSYKNPHLPRITDLATEFSDKNIKLLVLNHATALTGVADENVLARSSEMSFLDSNSNGDWDEGEDKKAFAVAAQYSLGKGKVNIISDPSILINSMVGRDDNSAFVQYLLLQSNTSRQVLLDSGRLTRTPLDSSKARLTTVTEVLSHPYFLVGLTALVCIMITGLIYKRGIIDG